MLRMATHFTTVDGEATSTGKPAVTLGAVDSTSLLGEQFLSFSGALVTLQSSTGSAHTITLHTGKRSGARLRAAGSDHVLVHGMPFHSILYQPEPQDRSYRHLELPHVATDDILPSPVWATEGTLL